MQLNSCLKFRHFRSAGFLPPAEGETSTWTVSVAGRFDSFDRRGDNSPPQIVGRLVVCLQSAAVDIRHVK